MDLEGSLHPKKEIASKLKCKEAFIYMFSKNNFIIPPKNLITWAFIQDIIAGKRM